ncbi:hypothetical protein G6F46_013367 [Rhizopus delemar]|nr:hypothetical protein G6F54_013354 [Rhizopus delemar]KAG1610536.1 hypothetical protein G6F45_013259 [Rhizopus arrhizus]KAG1490337.1 hypothetical protein G6F53_013268 [Rhizopus delemar]KAG1492680.1 hypothetical protein G6F52_013321 [Rhizopus delemar]KAG1536594.1 hypothetical protein G6F49_012951 [Rhizopus delemar]
MFAVKLTELYLYFRRTELRWCSFLTHCSRLCNVFFLTIKIVLNKVQSQKVFFWFIFVISFTLPEHNNWFQPIMAMITSQGQRLAQLEALTKENQNLRANLEAAQRRIKELETLSVPPAAAPTTVAAHKPAGSEA